MIHELSVRKIIENTVYCFYKTCGKYSLSSFKRKYGFQCSVQSLAPVYMHHTMPDSQYKDEFTGTIIRNFFTNPKVLSNSVILQ